MHVFIRNPISCLKVLVTHATAGKDTRAYCHNLS